MVPLLARAETRRPAKAERGAATKVFSMVAIASRRRRKLLQTLSDSRTNRRRWLMARTEAGAARIRRQQAGGPSRAHSKSPSHVYPLGSDGSHCAHRDGVPARGLEGDPRAREQPVCRSPLPLAAACAARAAQPGNCNAVLCGADAISRPWQCLQCVGGGSRGGVVAGVRGARAPGRQVSAILEPGASRRAARRGEKGGPVPSWLR